MKAVLYFQILSLCILASPFVTGSAYAEDGELSAELVDQIQSDCEMDAHIRAM